MLKGLETWVGKPGHDLASPAEELKVYVCMVLCMYLCMY